MASKGFANLYINTRQEKRETSGHYYRIFEIGSILMIRNNRCQSAAETVLAVFSYLGNEINKKRLPVDQFTYKSGITGLNRINSKGV